MGVEENKVQGRILDYLSTAGILAWRNNNTTTKGRAPGKHFMPGVGDIVGVLPDGTFLSIEVKTDTGRLSSDQKVFIDAVQERGGCAICARSIDDVIEELSYWL